METPDTAFSEFVGMVKSWIPRRSEPANLSRDFWMPDHSCRVCYECDSQFTIFNRRHHCRLCGRVFCGKCTANSVPILSYDPKNFQEEGERIRVCNFCFKQWEQEMLTNQNGIRASSEGLPSLSTMSLASSGTADSSSLTPGSFSYSTASYQRAPYGSNLSLGQSAKAGMTTDNHDIRISQRKTDSIPDIEIPSPNQFNFRVNRSDDDDEYGMLRSDSETQHILNSDIYYGPVEFDETIQDYHSTNIHAVQVNNDTKEIGSPLHDNSESHVSLDADKMADEAGPDNSCDDHTSSIYSMEAGDTEPMDFDNNEILWFPPDPEDGEDEREADIFDEDDDEDATGEWGYNRSSNSSCSGEYRSRDRTSEEHKKAMKNVVDGHFRALIAQLLQVENVPMGEEGDKGSWLEIITGLSWEAATLLKPDTSKGGGMDPGGYVKIKCIACGHRSQSMVVKGIVCKKNVAHRRMTSKIEKPCFLILEGALEYQRVTNSLSSFDTLLKQEMDHLKMAVAKIDAHHPHVLLVEKSVSRFAQDYLLAKNISLVLNIKRPLLERIARCTGAQIVSSIDHLSSQKLGQCDLFRVEKLLEEHGSAGQGGKKMVKTLMYFEECPKPLGCTILLMGASGDELKKLKHVIQYGIFAAYHLALETSFLADEGASLPELPLKSPITVALPDKQSSTDKSISRIPGFTTPSVGKPQLTIDVQTPKEIFPSFSSTTSGNMEAPTSTFVSPVGMKKSPGGKRDQVSTLSGLFSHSSRQRSPIDTTREKNKVCFGENREVKTITNNDQAVNHDANVPFSYSNGLETLNKSVMANGSQIQNGDTIGQLVTSTLANVQQENEQRTAYTLPKEEFPSDQSILVSLSTRSVWKGAICERSHLFRIKYYGSFDKPLGRFLRDNLFDQTFKCRSCELPPEAHVHCYTHHQGSLTISVRRHNHLCLPGERDGKIWMWHRCLQCPRVHGFPPATRRIVMSDAAWGLSFGKFLELSFSNHAAASRVANCGHSLHRDCLRFYGFGERVACFRYASIDVNNVYLPPHKLDFNCEHQEWIQREANEVSNRTELLFNEVLNALQQTAEGRTSSASTNGSSKVPELRNQIPEFEGMLQKERAEIEDSLQKLQDKEVRKGQPSIDILEVNKLRRQLLFQSYLWDQRLIFAAGSGSIAHEMPSGFLTREREKSSASEKLADLNLVPKTQISFTSSDTLSSDSRNDEPLKGNILAVSHQEGLYDQQKIDMDLDSFQGKQNILLPTCTSASDQLDPLEYGLVARRTLSDGQFPILANLSETFDAKWTGEENAPVLADASMSDSASVEATAAMSVSEDSEEQSGTEVTPSFASALLARLGDSAEDFPIWIGVPFLSIYRSMNKNLGITPRSGALCDYSPVHVSLFRELERQGGARLLLPIGVNDTVIPIYDDEPTSIISYALVSPDYHSQMSDERERVRDTVDASLLLPCNEAGNSLLSQSTDELTYKPFKSFGSSEDGILSLSGGRSSLILDPLTSTKAMHARVSFCDEGPIGKARYTVTCYYAKRFDALRRICCPSELDYIRSLSRCKKWGAQGGKSNVFFAKSLDDRFIIKQVTKTELESFIKFAPEYFKYLSESIGTGSPTCLAKILGIYQVTSKHLKGGKELKMDVLVMENLLFGRNVTRLYDLKGSLRSRYNTDCNNKVLLDQNLLEATSPIFVGNKAKRLLERAVWNDTSFLASVDVMDYSLLVGVDEVKHELVLGIIDFMRQYTWDKHLETWVKASGILGGPKNVAPTVISPKQYKKRFRKAMAGYFLVVPDQWSAPTLVPTSLQPESSEDNQQGAPVES